jgi:DNA helicase-2/ATP-dependent DNA helicase PcrA
MNQSQLSDLNPEQEKAVKHFEGPIMVFAGAGSGKTRVLTKRIASLVIDHGIRPDAIFAVTFTNKATEEMRHRMRGILGQGGERVWIGTFHSSALRILRRHAGKLGYQPNFNVYDDDDSLKIIKSVLAELKLDEKKNPPKVYSRIIDSAKNRGLSAEEYMTLNPPKNDKLRAAEVYELYQRALLRSNSMDFGDLLVNVVRLFKEHPSVRDAYESGLEFILVDEFQDTNPVQYEFLKLISFRRRNIFVVGDDDQSIYGFRGASIKNIELFKKDFSEAVIVKLEQNYRSTGNILATANAVIKANHGRTPKRLWTEGAAGAPVVTYVAWDEDDEARFIADEIKKQERLGHKISDMAILYRTNAQSRAIEEALLDSGIPYRIYGGLKFYDRREIKDIIAYLRLIINKSDNQAFLRIVNVPTRGMGPKAVEAIHQTAISGGTSLFEAAKMEVEKGAGKSLAAFIDLIENLEKKIESLPLSAFIDAVINETTYGPKLKAIGDEDALSRLENLQELKAIGASMEIEGQNKEILADFLDRVSLSSSQELPVEERKDSVKREPNNFVSLMTLHLAKGLEFPVVFFVGLEEGLLPHARSIDDGTIDEERRLCYVGITRAMKQLYVTRAKVRGMFSAGGSFGSGGGGGSYRDVSRFAKDMPEANLKHTNEKFSSFSAWSDSSVKIDEDFLDYESKSFATPKRDIKKKVGGETFIRRKAQSGASDSADSSKDKFKKLMPGLIKRADDLK